MQQTGSSYASCMAHLPFLCLQISSFLAHMPSTSVHEGAQQDPSSFCPCGAKVKGIPLRPQHLQTVPISKQSALATVGATERNLCSSFQVHLPPGQVLSHSYPFSSLVGQVHHVWTQGFRSAVGSTSPEFSRFYLLFLHGRETLWEVWRLHEVAGF